MRDFNILHQWSWMASAIFPWNVPEGLEPPAAPENYFCREIRPVVSSATKARQRRALCPGSSVQGWQGDQPRSQLLRQLQGILPGPAAQAPALLRRLHCSLTQVTQHGGFYSWHNPKTVANAIYYQPKLKWVETFELTALSSCYLLCSYMSMHFQHLQPGRLLLSAHLLCY